MTKKTEYEKLTPEAKKFADANGFLTDEKIKEIAKQLRITARLDWGIKREEYSKWSISKLFERCMEQNRKNPMMGA
jgi:lantibiotic modifying enzyme